MIILETPVFGDERGYFMESYRKELFEEAGIADDFVQDNVSMTSSRHTLRGLHLQKPPFAQAKLVMVHTGSVLDVAVDLRSNSPTYGRHHAVELQGGSGKLFYIPAGFAHGFITKSEHTIFSYKCSARYDRSSEVTIQWNDPDLNIAWECVDPLLSEKDKEGIPFRNFVSPF